MSTNQQTYGTNVYPSWVWVLPNDVYDAPNTMSVDRVEVDELGNETTVTLGFSIREYFTQPEANIGLLSNRTIIPLPNGTHSVSVFDSDIDDILNFQTMLDSAGMVNGGRDYTLDSQNLYYSMPISQYEVARKESPLNVAPVPEEVVV